MLEILLIIYFESYEFCLQRVSFYFCAKYVSVYFIFGSICNFCALQLSKSTRDSIKRWKQFIFKRHNNIIIPTSLISLPSRDKRDFSEKNKLKI